MSKKGTVPFKHCVVPLCPNTTKKTPSKLFFQVPRKPAVRRKWFKAMGRDWFLSSTTSRHCCEDHFNMQEDTVNYWQYKLCNVRARLKKDIVPHIFDCQDKSDHLARPERQCVIKRRKVEEAVEGSNEESETVSLSSDKNDISEKTEIFNQYSNEIQINCLPLLVDIGTTTEDLVYMKSIALSPIKVIEPRCFPKIEFDYYY